MIDAAGGAPGYEVKRSAKAELTGEHLAGNLYFDRTFNLEAVKVLPGEYYVTTHDMVLTTVLRSCVAACIRDAGSGIGGMNHFMLPEAVDDGPVGSSARYGTYAMEILINHLTKIGARRANLEAKVFGGGNVLQGLTVANIGQRNAEFVLHYLATERIRVVARDLVDVHPRKICYLPASGKVMVKKLRPAQNANIFDREQQYSLELRRAKVEGDVELFG
jgi:chemotaxis protein CheD